MRNPGRRSRVGRAVWASGLLLLCAAAYLLQFGGPNWLGVPWAANSVQAAGQEFESREAAIADALEKNGPIFVEKQGSTMVDWPKPQLALVFSGEMDGYLEPCGCAGLDNQKGGLKRRLTFLEKLADDGWPVVAMDMGGQIRRFGPQADIKYRVAIQALTKLGYQAVGLGIKELQLDANYLAYVLSNFEGGTNPVISANVTIIDPTLGLSNRYRVIERAGKKIGVTSVLGKKHQAGLQNASDISWADPVPALQQVVAELQAQNCDLLTLLVHADLDEASELARQFPQFQFVASTGGAETPPNRLVPVKGMPEGVPAPFLIEAGHKGQYLTVVGIYDDPNEPLRLERVPLDHRFEDHPVMQDLLVEYQDELKTLGLAGLGLSSTKHPVDTFAGSAACADCHTEATEIFEGTPHSYATQTLVDLEPPRHFDPECLSCHVTGWNPQEFFPYASGFQGLKETPQLTDNGCENCHGPGASHVAAESGEAEVDDQEIERLRALMRLKIVENEGNKPGQEIKNAVVVTMCMQCHDEDNSPDFDFQEYWPQVEHAGMD